MNGIPEDPWEFLAWITDDPWWSVWVEQVGPKRQPEVTQ